MWELSQRAYWKINAMVKRGQVSWRSLPKELQEEMDEAVAMLSELAAQGHMLAQADLVLRGGSGSSLPRPNPFHSQGLIYHFGEAVEQNDDRAYQLYSQAAEQGCGHSQHNLAVVIANGRGCVQSHERAVYWWSKAAARGHRDAQADLGLAYQSGKGVQQDARAAQLYKSSGVPKAIANLAGCYRMGWGVPASYAKCRRLYKQSDLGDYATKVNLQQLDHLAKNFAPLLDRNVQLRALNTKDMNGARGKVVDFGFAGEMPGPTSTAQQQAKWYHAGRYTVQLSEGGKLVKVKRENVEAV